MSEQGSNTTRSSLCGYYTIKLLNQGPNMWFTSVMASQHVIITPKSGFSYWWQPTSRKIQWYPVSSDFNRRGGIFRFQKWKLKDLKLRLPLENVRTWKEQCRCKPNQSLQWCSNGEWLLESEFHWFFYKTHNWYVNKVTQSGLSQKPTFDCFTAVLIGNRLHNFTLSIAILVNSEPTRVHWVLYINQSFLTRRWFSH